MTPAAEAFDAASEATWPPAATWTSGAFLLRDGAGGGKRVSAATLAGDFDSAELDAVLATLDRPLFRVRRGQEALDTALAARGFDIVDPTCLRVARAEAIARAQPPATVLPGWPALSVNRRIWAAGGIGPERIAVMDRVAGPKAALLGRSGDAPGATGFVALDGDIAFVHALEVAADARRSGLGTAMMQGAADWALGQGAIWMGVLVTTANVAANRLYARLGMAEIGGYHYRTAP